MKKKSELITGIIVLIVGAIFTIGPIAIGIAWATSAKRFDPSMVVVFSVSIIGIIMLISGIKTLINYFKN